MHPAREGKILAGGGPDTSRYVREHVEPREITGAEGGRTGPADERAGEAVHVVDGEPMLLHTTHGGHHAVHAEAVGDEAGYVLRDHDSLAERALRKLAHDPDHHGIRLRRRNDLEQMHVARRIEEVRAEEAAPERLPTPVEQRGHRNARRVRRHDGGRLHERFDAREQLLLGFRQLDDRFADPVALGEPREMVVGVAGPHARRRSGFHERGRLALDGLLQANSRRGTAIGGRRVVIAGDIEQHDAAAGRRREGGNAAPHGAGAYHTDSRHAHAISLRKGWRKHPWGDGVAEGATPKNTTPPSCYAECLRLPGQTTDD